MRNFLLMVALLATAVTASAQKEKTRVVETTTSHSETTYQYTQARMPQVLVEPLVKPLVVEVQVIENAPTFYKKALSRLKVERELEGSLENVYNYGCFLYTEETKSDMIVAATYNFYTNPDRTGNNDWYILEIKGFPAKFVNWHTATTADYEWMRIRHEGANNPVVKPIVTKK